MMSGAHKAVLTVPLKCCGLVLGLHPYVSCSKDLEILKLQVFAFRTSDFKTSGWIELFGGYHIAS